MECGYKQVSGKLCTRTPEKDWPHCRTHMRISNNREWNRANGISNLRDISDAIRNNGRARRGRQS